MSGRGDGAWPKITVGLPTFNGGVKIIKAVTSVIGQGYENLEIIISDNCSTDDTQDVCRELCEQYPNIKYHRQPWNAGVVANYSYVLAHATGDYFMWLADDDTLAPGILEKYVSFLTENNGYALVSGEVKYWDGDRIVQTERDFTMEQSYASLRVINYYFKVLHGAIFYGLMDRKTAQSIPLRNRIGDDWHYVASLAFVGKIKNLDTPAYNKKFGGVSVTMKNYAKVIGASWFSANFPHVTIALDSLYEIVVLSPLYTKTNIFSRIGLGLMTCTSVIVSHYVKVYPFILAGRVKRLFVKPNVSAASTTPLGTP